MVYVGYLFYCCRGYYVFVHILRKIAKERGLHVWNNIQCLPQNLNCSKQNKLIYTDPHEWLYDIPKFFEVVYQQEIAA